MKLSEGFWKELKSPEKNKNQLEPGTLRELLRKVRRIEITTKKAVNEIFAGEYHSVFKGRGMEFLEVREYYPGDEVRTIDWNVTARFGSPYVKLFAEERELTVIIMVDASSSLRFGTVDKTKAELCAELAGLFGFSAIQNNDRVGLIIFTDRIELYLPPKKGLKNGLRLIREVLGFVPERKATDINLALDFLFRVQKRKAVVFLLSDFLGSGYEEKLKVASRRYDLVNVVLTDPREQEFPSLGLVELEDMESGETVLVDTSDPRVKEHLAQMFAGVRERQNQLFKGARADAIQIVAGQRYEAELVKFFRERARRALR